ncbi:MAG TPA: hypothetical protein VMI56_21060 [Reyranella sp.]|nr:hypothetical protein [Reyranella sp.]
MGIFSGAPAPYVPPLPAAPPPPPTPVDPNVVAAANATKARLAASAGYGGNILNGGQGIATDANVGRKTLLGQ